MKQLTKVFLLFFLLGPAVAFSQNYKFGHINSEELIALMPERDSAVVTLERHGNQLEEELQSLQTEFQTKLRAYEQKAATWTASTLEAKQKELQDLEVRMQRYQQSAQGEFQELQQALFQPIIIKANEAITRVGKEQGLIYIFDTSVGATPYIDFEKSIDVLPLVRTILNIPADKTPKHPNEL